MTLSLPRPIGSTDGSPPSSNDDRSLTLAASIDVTGPHPAARVVVSGALRTDGAVEVAQVLTSLAEDGVVHVDVDLTDLRECTVADLVTLLDADRVIEQRGGALRVISAEGEDRQVTDLLGQG
jgi:hypothetical protein